jgi:hypothetical protein
MVLVVRQAIPRGGGLRTTAAVGGTDPARIFQAPRAQEKK